MVPDTLPETLRYSLVAVVRPVWGRWPTVACFAEWCMMFSRCVIFKRMYESAHVLSEEVPSPTA